RRNAQPTDTRRRHTVKITDRLAATPAFDPASADRALDVALARAGLRDAEKRQVFRDGPAAGAVKRTLEQTRTMLVQLFDQVDAIRTDRRRTEYGRAVDARDAIRRGFASIKST